MEQVATLGSSTATAPARHWGHARSFIQTRNATLAALIIGYIGFYLCRQNFAEAYAPMHGALGIDKKTFGAIASFGTLIYAFGKLVTGPLADAKGGRAVFLFGLAASAAATFTFGLASAIPAFFVIWGANRFYQSMGWGSAVNVLAQWFPPRNYGTAMGVLSISYQLGGVVASLFAGALLAAGLDWRGLFIVPALTLAAVGLVIRPYLVASPRDAGFASLAPCPKTGHVGDDETPMTSAVARFADVLRDRRFLSMCALSFLLTFIRECFTLWMPAYFYEHGATASTAAFKSAVFPLLGCAGTLLAGWLSDRWLDGRRGPIMAVFLAGLLLSLAGLATLNWTGTANLVLVGLAGFFLFGPYSLVGGGVVALDFGGRRSAATAAGVLDSAGYFAATLAGFGVAQLVTTSGWQTTFGVLAGLTALSIALCATVWRTRP